MFFAMPRLLFGIMKLKKNNPSWKEDANKIYAGALFVG